MNVTVDLIANGEMLVVGRLVDATNASLLAQIKAVSYTHLRAHET